jgi:asparagine synthase (glutamine-hydrolysing)
LRLLVDTAKDFLPAVCAGSSMYIRPPSWLNRGFAKKHQSAFAGRQSRLRLFGPLPSFQENLSTLDNLRRQLACDLPPAMPAYDKRYPYLDRDLLEFICAVPREQLLRPGERRSLMRRAMSGILPDEILNRRRKAFVARGPILALAREAPTIMRLTEDMIAHSLGIIDTEVLRKAVQNGRRGEGISVVLLTRALGLEYWFRCATQELIKGLPRPSPAQVACAGDGIVPPRLLREREKLRLS